MSRELQGAPLWRCLVVWSAAAVASLVVLVVAGREVAAASATSFDSLLVGGCAVVLVGCAGWFWLAATVVLAGAARGARWTPPGCPRWLTRTLLAGCGLALLVPAAPVHAAADPAPGPIDVLAGLPLPDRPVSRDPGAVRAPRATVVVRPGDSLWAIARRSLPADAGPAEVDRRWRAIWAANRTAVGTDPDLIHPGAELRLPREES